uniref:Uncharacterized protein n=1 Tax=Anguilla anguilla TaxID=7936 RepID=A0A0E9XPQ8_ANGAN
MHSVRVCQSCIAITTTKNLGRNSGPILTDLLRARFPFHITAYMFMYSPPLCMYMYVCKRTWV